MLEKIEVNYNLASGAKPGVVMSAIREAAKREISPGCTATSLRLPSLGKNRGIAMVRVPGDSPTPDQAEKVSRAVQGIEGITDLRVEIVGQIVDGTGVTTLTP